MRTAVKVSLVLAVLMVVAGIVGGFFFNNHFVRGNNDINQGCISEKTMYNYKNTFRSTKGEVIELETLKNNVLAYIEPFDGNLVISDIFLFEDSEYYFSIMDEDTGIGAMELLVNQYTGDVFPEFGPNMMWNLKYGMHTSSGYGMMGNRGMMGRFSSDKYYETYNSDLTRNTITHEDAQLLAAAYVEENSVKAYTVSEGGHEFYGYYTYHIEDSGKTVGMLSVNGITGDIWYHDWHGTVTEVISVQESNDNH